MAIISSQGSSPQSWVGFFLNKSLILTLENSPFLGPSARQIRFLPNIPYKLLLLSSWTRKWAHLKIHLRSSHSNRRGPPSSAVVSVCAATAKVRKFAKTQLHRSKAANSAARWVLRTPDSELDFSLNFGLKFYCAKPTKEEVSSGARASDVPTGQKVWHMCCHENHMPPI